MFGPNTYFTDSVNICYSHRDKCFFDLFTNVRNLFSEKFHLEEYDILFVPGSGTIGVEALIYSLKYPVHLIGHDGTFKRRWTELASNYAANKSSKKSYEMFCLLETSCSRHFSKPGCIVDAISGFPYYDLPQNTLAFVTCLNKQLGSYVGLSVVGIRKDFWCNLIDEGHFSYLNLSRYLSYHNIGQAPSTSPTYIYEHFYRILNHFDLADFRKRLNIVSDMIIDVIGSDNVIGNKRGPVITLRNGIISESLARQYDIYGYWAGRPNYQIFTYSDKIENYEIFLKDLKSTLSNKEGH